jgi:BirA family transcriptional regulator, biotin operon repressor / biotin---[acetyl-CoA-carboxylase] ligase
METLDHLRRQACLDELGKLGWLQHIEWQAQVDSTNEMAKRWCASQTNFTPALFLADEQTAGRGRSGHVWWSPRGCLMFTLALPNALMPKDPSQHSQLALLVGLAVGQAAESTLRHKIQPIGQLASPLAMLKWPNDVFWVNRKLAGILIESVLGGWAIGVGVNCCVDWRSAPPEIQTRATCLSTVADLAVDTESVLLEFVAGLYADLQLWRNGSEAWLKAWHLRCLLTGCNVVIKQGDGALLAGRCEGIDRSGRLLVRTADQLYTLNSGEVVQWEA